MNKKDIKTVITIIIIILVIAVAYLVLNNIYNKEETYDYMKKYEANEYIPTYISNDDMAKIYLNDYLYNMRYSQDNGYKLLNKDYKNLKFPSIELYKNYISNFINENIMIAKYLKYSIDGFMIFKIYDNIGNTYVFKTKGVMQYEVYLDDYTIEI